MPMPQRHLKGSTCWHGVCTWVPAVAAHEIALHGAAVVVVVAEVALCRGVAADHEDVLRGAGGLGCTRGRVGQEVRGPIS